MATRILSFLIISCGLVFSLPAEDTADYEQLIRQLDSSKFSERRAATQELRDAGKAAFETLRRAADSDSAEVTSRSIEILKHHLDNSDASTKQAAKAALEALAESKNEMAARLAYRALNPKKEEEPVEQPAGGIGFGPVQIQMQIRAAKNNRQKMQIRVQNGIKSVEIEEGDRKIKIHEDANGIKVEVTEKIDGKEETKKYEAKDAAELQRKHPKAFKEYSKLKHVGGGIQIQGGGIQIQGNILPIPQLRGRIQRVPAPNNAPNGVQPLQQPLKHIDQQIEKYKAKIADGDANAEHFRRMVENLEKHRQQLEQAIRRIEESRKKTEQRRENAPEEAEIPENPQPVEA